MNKSSGKQPISQNKPENSNEKLSMTAGKQPKSQNKLEF